jgi:trimethylamine:corrinoid methyltransferase-like protein
MRREFRPSRLANRQNPEVWIAQGGCDIVQLAAARVAEALRGSPEPRCDKHVAEELELLVNKQ